MKSKPIYLMAILVMGFLASTLAQDTIQISFTASYNDESVPLDSILIRNLNQFTDTMLYAPDTVLMVEFCLPQGVNHPQQAYCDFSVSPNYPNPFGSQTAVDVCIEEADDIVIRIFDLLGREHACLEDYFDAGNHTFTFSPGQESFYIFSLWYQGLTRSIKIANPLSSQSECKLSYNGFVKRPSTLKSGKDGCFQIIEGDKLRYFGYASVPDGFSRAPVSDVIEEIPGPYNNTHQFDVSLGIPCVDMPTIDYGGQIYNTVQIGTQCWFKENLNIGTMIMGMQEQTDNDTIEKYCYSDNPASCDIFGGLYQWDEAMKYSTQLGERGLCPPGWHIPTDEEFNQLEGEADSYYSYPDPIWDSAGYRGFDAGKRLKSPTTWESDSGTDAVGFKALGTGCRFIDGNFMNRSRYTSFWSSKWFGGTIVTYRYLEDWEDGSCRSSAPKNMGRSVRCLRN